MKVEVDKRLLLLLRDNPEVALKAMDTPLHAATRRILDISLFLVPRGGAPDDPVDLADTAFLSGPLHNPEKKSTTWTCGYAHPAAGAIHQGFHWGAALLAPPDFLRRATKGVRAELKKPVGKALMGAIASLTPKGHRP
ncbi:hypothetical protein I3V78_29235 [Archangium primigenium]|nr:hypothetical protein [Archangium primigenium]